MQKNPSNYRPISILSVFSKVFEKVIKLRLTKYLLSNNLLASQQYGFRNQSNTKCAAFDFVYALQKHIDQGKHAAGLFIDLKKAFDTVDHGILLKKLEHLGIVGTPLKLLCSYLSNRHCQTFVGKGTSSMGTIKCGVPQGSVLGPLLFLIYINDIAKWGLKGSIQLYADDTVILYHNNDLNELEKEMERDIACLANWLRLNKLSLNIKKTHYILFANKKNVSLNISLDNNRLDRADVTKYLGLFIDSQLTWNHQFKHVLSKITPITGVLYRLRGLLPPSLLKSIYHAMIHSHLIYLAGIWGFATKKMISEVQVVQNRALRNIFSLPWDTHVKDIYRNTQILPFNTIPTFEITKTILQVIQHSAHSNTTLYYNCDVHQHNTRNHNKLHIPKIKSTKYGLRSLEYIAHTKYNQLPNEIKCASQCKKTQTNMLKLHLMNDYLK